MAKWDEIRNIHKQYKGFYDLLGGFSVVGLLVVLGLLIFAADKMGYSTNVYTELIGVSLTILVLDRRAKQRSIAERKETLIFQMGSPIRDTAVDAVRVLRRKGWLEDGSLKGTILWHTNLQEADLRDANLQKGNLFLANLEGANLGRANLQRAYLGVADLQRAKLTYANLEEATLFKANLQGAYLNYANLEGSNWHPTNLQEANLKYANLQGAKFNTDTILPDGSNWKEGRDMRQFTHPDEWQAEQAS
jgi:uncharacterized protein YjbI with pentapeptide repeats